MILSVTLMLNISCCIKIVRGVCTFLGYVLPQQQIEVTDAPVLQPGVTAQFYLASKGKYILEA